MEHKIETNLDWTPANKVAVVNKLLEGVPTDLMVNVEVWCGNGGRIKVVVRGNGATLRDVVMALDRAGLLD